MERVRLGSSNLEVSRLALGTMQFGWTADEANSFAVLDAYMEAGGNLIDTADIYSRWVNGHEGGESERIIGRWLRERGGRARVVIATKVRGRMWAGPDGEGLSRAHITRACEESLRRLGVETIDLYQCHPRRRRIRAVLPGEGLPAFVSLQPHYNLVRRTRHDAGGGGARLAPGPARGGRTRWRSSRSCCRRRRSGSTRRSSAASMKRARRSGSASGYGRDGAGSPK